MKKIMTAIVALMTFIIPANAMSYEQAREQALFLTDKMAYELNLTEDQYEAAYEVNLDYLMSISTYDDLYGVYWRNRNLDMSYILLDWQYNAFCAASYFYRPLYWSAGAWHFGIYARYPHRSYLYFGRPHFYVSYTGGHSWRMNGGRSWYHGRTFGSSHRRATNNHGPGMKDGFHRGYYNDRNHRFNDHGDRGNNNHGGNDRNHNNNGVGNHGNNGNGGNVRPGTQDGRRPSNVNGDNGGFRGNRNSSTRTTAPSGDVNNNRRGSGDRGSVGTSPNNRFSPSVDRPTHNSSVQRNTETRSSSNNHNFSGGSSSSYNRVGSGSHSSGSSSRGGSVSSGSHSGGSSRGGGHFGGRR